MNTSGLAAAWLADFERQKAELRIKDLGKLTLRRFLESDDFARPYLLARRPLGFLEREVLTPAVWAIVDAVDGHGRDVPTELCRRLFRCDPHDLPTDRRRTVVVGAGGRGGKTSTLLAPAVIHAAWTCPLDTLAPGEQAAALIIAPRRRNARQCFLMIKGLIESSPILRAAVISKKAQSIVLRRPDGREVVIEIVAPDRGGNNQRSYALVFAAIDEAAFFAAGEAIVNDRDVCAAILQRLVPGGQMWLVSTPWVEGLGEMETIIEAEWGKHRSALVAARVGTRMLNPTWDPSGEIERDYRLRYGDEAANREILAIPLPRGQQSLFDHLAIKDCLRLRAPDVGFPLATGAGVDLGFTGDPSALVIVRRWPAFLFGIPRGGIMQRFPEPTKPLSPSIVCADFARHALLMGASTLGADNVYKESLREMADIAGISVEFISGDRIKEQTYLAAAEVILRRKLALGDLDDDDQRDIAEQLYTVRKKADTGGRLVISAPRIKLADAATGIVRQSHADAVSGLVIALRLAGAGVGAAPMDPQPDDDDEGDENMPRYGEGGVDQGIGWNNIGPGVGWGG